MCRNSKINIEIMEWPISGEFFIYPFYEEVIKITRQYMEEYSNFRPFIILNDNLVLMNENRIELILGAGIVKQIICSIDGYDARSFEEMRPPAKFDVVLKNMRNLIKRNKELGNPVIIQVNNGRDVEDVNKPFSSEMREIFNIADDVSFWQPQYWNESFNKTEYKFRPAKGFCSFVFNNVTLSASGYLSKCCMDLKGMTEYADFTKDNLKNIWHSKARYQFLALMFRNKRALIKGCGNCSITYTNNNNRVASNFGIKRIFRKKLLRNNMGVS
jgi:hypothetical protein